MKKINTLFLIGILLSSTWLLSGCWNYKEVEQLSIVSGATIDMVEKDKVLVTVEIISVKQDPKQSALEPVYIQAIGDTFFDAVRQMVAVQGKRLYWSHAKVIVLGEEVAKRGVSHVLDFLNRDAEIREDMWVLLSRENTASAIFYAKPETESIQAYELDYTLRAQKAISRYPAVELYRFLDMISSKNTTAILPTLKLIYERGKTTTYVTGSAIIKSDKLIGYLNEQESKSLLWIREELKGGLFVVRNAGKVGIDVTLEINKSKTEIKPFVEDNKLIMKVYVDVDVNIAEIMGREDFISEDGRNSLKKEAEKQIKKSLDNLIEKSQKELKADLFGFGETIERSIPGIPENIIEDWDEFFIDLETLVDVNVTITGSGTSKTPVKVGK
ncbi:MAG TPA: Ger(x)C family spore germination protein [Clostridia bacterium]|nr:Ger(x)C family spore germination protein [Clostridia bacterium]